VDRAITALNVIEVCLMPKLTLFIPTFERPRHLEALLTDLSRQLQTIDYAVEILISDDSPQQSIQEVVDKFNELPIRYVLQERTLGYCRNFFYCQQEARGEYSAYLADDDYIDLVKLGQVLQRMDENPSVGAAYAPWAYYDRINDRIHGQFYTQQECLLIKSGEHLLLTEHLLRHRIFPEHYVARRVVTDKLQPAVSEISYWAFVQVAQLLRVADILFLDDPYYLSTTANKYFETDERQPAGAIETETAWDKYRGGLEYLVSTTKQLSLPKREQLLSSINTFVAERMAIGLRLRIKNQRNPIDNYLLAKRILGLTPKATLPISIGQLRSIAALYYLGTDPLLLRGRTRINVLGNPDSKVLTYLNDISTLPIVRNEEVRSEDLVFSRTGEPDLCGQKTRVVYEKELLQRFE